MLQLTEAVSVCPILVSTINAIHENASCNRRPVPSQRSIHTYIHVEEEKKKRASAGGSCWRGPICNRVPCLHCETSVQLHPSYEAWIVGEGGMIECCVTEVLDQEPKADAVIAPNPP
jgi:hypothetical protein